MSFKRKLRIAKSEEEGEKNDSLADEDDFKYWRSESEKFENSTWKLDKKIGKLSLRRNKILNYISQIDKEC